MTRHHFMLMSLMLGVKLENYNFPRLPAKRRACVRQQHAHGGAQKSRNSTICQNNLLTDVQVVDFCAVVVVVAIVLLLLLLLLILLLSLVLLLFLLLLLFTVGTKCASTAKNNSRQLASASRLRPENSTIRYGKAEQREFDCERRGKVLQLPAELQDAHRELELFIAATLKVRRGLPEESV